MSKKIACILSLSLFVACQSEPPRHTASAGEPIAAEQASFSAAPRAEAAFAKPGFVTRIDENRLWVFAEGQTTEPSEKSVTLVGAGPNGMTVRANDRATAVAYLATRPGFEVEVEDERIWVFREGASTEKTEKCVTLVGAGPLGRTLKGQDRETLDAYLALR